MDAQLPSRILLLTAGALAAFGVVVLTASTVLLATGKSPRPLVTKYLAWFAIAPVLVVPLAYWPAGFQCVILLVSLQCIREFSRATGLWRDRTMMRLCYGLTLLIYVPVLAGWEDLHRAAPLVAMAVLLATPILRGRYDHMLQEVCLSLLAVLYFGWFLSHLAILRNIDHGLGAAFFLIVLVACNDAFGYLWGRSLGRHKLSPKISPNKTIEGAVIAAFCVVALGCLLAGLLPGLTLIQVAGISGVIAVVGVLGDLVISFIKRDVGVKDMGAAIPGHGGILDRCDSLILAAPIYFHLLNYFHAN